MKAIAIIPARGGSERIPRKNIRYFCGKPMIAWSIETAQASGCFSRIIVSTDDSEIAAVAREHGAETPFNRPQRLANDHAPTVPVIAHAIEQLKVPPEQPTCCLYATAPFVSVGDLRKGQDLLFETPYAFVFPVTTFAYPIQRALLRNHDGQMQMFAPELAQTRSQDLEEAWHDTGQFYWALAKTWATKESIFDGIAHGIPIDRSRVQDIDTLEDWKQAEKMAQVLNMAEHQTS